MREIRCLYWDDEKEDDRRRYEAWIRRAWEKLETGVSIRITTVGTPGEALEELMRAPNTYELLVADIYLGLDDSDPRGLHLIDEVRGMPSLAIVALSRGTDEGRARALDAGADAFVSKQFLSRVDTKLTSLSEALFESLRRKGHEPIPAEEISLQYDEENLLLAALIETIGRSNLISLAVKLSRPRNIISLRAFFVQAGLSGALVVRADCEVAVGERKAPETLSLLIKMSRDRSQLEAEILKRQEVGTFPTGLFVPFGESRIVDSGGWYGIGANFQASARTLVDWLIEGPANDAVSTALSSLLLDGGLKDVYRHTFYDAEERPVVALWRILALPRRARIRLALDEFSKLAGKHGPAGVYDRELILDFVSESKRVVDLNEEDFSKGVYLCRAHGDLHGRNVLVVQGRINNARIVDPANIQQAHWAADIARLSVDLLVSGLSPGADSYEWDLSNEWLELAQAYVRNDVACLSRASSKNAGLIAALLWIRANLNEIYSSVTTASFEAEFRLALAVEFLRASYRQQDLAAPKRVLGLLAGCAALRDAALEYSRVKNTV